jgi:lipoic acid synthetase
MSTIELPVIPQEPQTPERRPEWLKVRIPGAGQYGWLYDLVRTKSLHTVCEEARCPNMAECWAAGTATFMILGDTCTRSCGFCSVKTGRPGTIDWDEPNHVAEAIRAMKVKHAVITSVNRDELADGGASVFAATVTQSRALNPNTRIEVLIPDFKGDNNSLDILLASKPDILGHNTETVPRLYRDVRPQGNYQWTLGVLKHSKEKGFVTKTGIMLGLGETLDEVREVMRDLRTVGTDILTLGQYLQPTKQHLPVVRFIHPDEFALLKTEGMAMGFMHIESGPLVRSSYHAERAVE